MIHTTLISQISENGNRQGFLDAMNIIAKITPGTGHPVEAETLDRVYELLKQGYTERYRGGEA